MENTKQGAAPQTGRASRVSLPMMKIRGFLKKRDAYQRVKLLLKIVCWLSLVPSTDAIRPQTWSRYSGGMVVMIHPSA
jgi:hypothetical protein